MDITIENLTKRFDDQIAVKNLSLEIKEPRIIKNPRFFYKEIYGK